MEEYNTIRELGAEVLGIGVDSVDSHRAFSDKLGGCPFPLLSDHTLEVARLYDALGDDSRKSLRALYVIDEQGLSSTRCPGTSRATWASLWKSFRPWDWSKRLTRPMFVPGVCCA